jgi:PAS domain S-box-containing protein
MSKRPTYEELKKRLAEAEALIASLRGGEVGTITGELDIALLGVRELEEAYIESEQNFRNAMDESPLGIRIVNEDGELLYANQSILDICGLGSVEELKAIPRKQLYTPESYAGHQARTERRQRGEFLTGNYEISVRRPDGEARNLQVFRKEIIWGGESHYMSMYQDITERKRAEEKIRESEGKYRELAESITDVYYALDDNLRYTYWNTASETLTGVSAENALGKYLYDIFPDTEETKKAEVVYRRVLETKKPEQFINEYHFMDKGYFFEISAYPAQNGLSVFVKDITEHKRAEEELVLQRDFAHSVFNTAQVIMLVLDPDGRIVSFNPYLEEISGYRLEEVKGKYWFDTFVPERGRHKIKRLFQRGIDNIQRRGSINPILTKDGREREIEWHDKTLKDISGNVIGLLAVGQDITERRKAEEKHRTILKTALDGFWMVDLKGKMLDFNDSYCNMVGYTREELLKMSIMDLEAIESPEDILRRIKTIVEQGHARFESRHKRKDGRIIDVEVSTNYLEVGEGQIFVFVRDITGRKQAEERINHLNRTLHSIRNINQMITREKDRDRLINGACNTLVESHSFYGAWIALLDESRKLITYTESGFGKELSPLLQVLKQGEIPPCAQRAIKQGKVVLSRDAQDCAGCPLQPEFTKEGGITARLEYGGNIYGVLCASMPASLLSDQDEITLFEEVATDIAFALHDISLEAEHKLLEQEQLRSAKLESISTLAGGIAHDFNNLLTGIMGNIGLAKTYIKPADQAFETLDEAEKAAVRARGLTQLLLTFARGGKPVKKIVDIAELIKESATFALRGSDVRLELSLPDDLWPVEVDEGQMNQVINNVVINADEAMPAGGILKIGAENSILKEVSALPLPKGKYIRIDIKDTGVGISKDHLDRIFEPYFTTKKKGSGLGLSTVYSIIKNHGGYIVAESAQNKGSAFHIYLPASKKPARAKKEPAPRNAVPAGGKILVMDDEEIIRKMLNNMLSLAGYKAELTSDGAEALEKYAEALESGEPFDAVIMDLTIPGGMGGKEAVKKLLKIDPGARVIVSSGYATDAIMSEYKKYGFCAVIAKPYSVKQLEETLRSLPRRKKPS